MTVLGRHAVVIIHGIGEQAPLSTVRGFVGRRTPRSRGEELKGGVVTDADAVFAEPSPVTARTDELIYSVTWNHAARADRLRDTGWTVQERSAVTEFYEFYWAPRFRATTMGHVTGWLVPLLRRRLRTFTTPRLRGPRGAVRALPAVALVLALLAVTWSVSADAPVWQSVGLLVLGVLAAMIIGTFLGLVAAAKVLVLCVVASAIGAVLVWGLESTAAAVGAVSTSAVVLALGTWIASRITRTLGDAARYLAGDDPDNVEENEAIRARVVDLLEELRDARDPDTGRARYDRVVVVGHSLGSVIAYDAVRLLWARTYRSVVLPSRTSTGLVARAVGDVEALGVTLRSGAEPLPDDTSSADLPGSLDDWTAAQRAAGLTVADDDPLRGGRRWIISDLITLGCPLTYADAFMGSSGADLRDRFEERSLAANPPVEQTVRRASSHPFRLWIPGPGGGSTRFHHAAPFATVRWTNAWFEHDIVGGPVAPHFGSGVRDVSLGGTRWMAGMAFAYPHSSYWVASRRSLVRGGSEAGRALLKGTVHRRPTLLLTARSPLDDATLTELADLLRSEPAVPGGAVGAAGDLDVDVRLYVGPTDAERRGSYFPLETVRLPARRLLPGIKTLLGPGSRVALLASPDLHAEPRPGTLDDREPVEVDEARGEELEALGAEREREPVGEEE